MSIFISHFSTSPMCLYTYHHYPLCGHISNWTVTSCLEFTSQLRLLNGTGHILCCNDVEVTHDLHPTAPHSLCTQCDFNWAEAMTSNEPDTFQPRIYRAIEGLDAKFPMIEFAVRMTVDTSNNATGRSPRPSTGNSQADSAASARKFTPCHCFSCSCKGFGNSGSSSACVEGEVSPAVGYADLNPDYVKQLDRQGGGCAPSTDEGSRTGRTGNGVLPSPEGLTADILQALAKSTSTQQSRDCPAVYPRAPNANPADAKAVNHGFDTVKTPVFEPEGWSSPPPENVSFHHVGRPRYIRVPDVDTASHEISQHPDEAGSRIQVQLELERIEESPHKIPSSSNREHDNHTTRGHRGSTKRPGTPYADMDLRYDQPRRFIAAASEQEARELGLNHPLRIANLYAGF